MRQQRASSAPHWQLSPVTVLPTPAEPCNPCTVSREVRICSIAARCAELISWCVSVSATAS
jgi:hypothetical protein